MNHNKKLLFIPMMIINMLFSCNFPYDNYQKMMVEVEIKYDEESHEAKIDLPDILKDYNKPYYNKSKKNEVLEKLIGGDVLEIYYDETGVKRVLVDKASIIELKYSCTPGCGPETVCNCSEGALFPANEKNFKISGIEIPYDNLNIRFYDLTSRYKVINNEDLFFNMRYFDGIFTTIFYATYYDSVFSELDVKYKNYNSITIYVNALYDYMPR